MADRVSTYPAAKAALVALLSAQVYPAHDTWEGQPAVSYGDPGRNVEREQIVVGDMEEPSDEEWAPFGQRTREETYSIPVDVLVNHPGASQQEATERAYDLLDVIAGAIRDVRALTAGVHATELKGALLFEAPIADEGHAALLSTAVRITARF